MSARSGAKRLLDRIFERDFLYLSMGARNRKVPCGSLDRTAEIELGVIHAATDNRQQICEAPYDATDRHREVREDFCQFRESCLLI